MLVVPEDDATRRRHAHTSCVMRARDAGRLPLIEDDHARPRSFLSRLLRRDSPG
jgi:hypothetical protein